MNGHDGVAIVVVAGEQRLGLQLVDQRAQVVHFAAQIGGNIFAFVRQIEVGGDVAGAARQFVVRGQRALQPLLLAHHLLRFFGIRPERGIGGLLFDLAQLFAQLGRVKDTPVDRGPCREARRIPVLILRPC